MVNLVGPIPEPENLHGRRKTIRDAWSLLKENNLLLLGPRRFGKSGVLRHLLRFPQHGALPLSFDLEDVTTCSEFVRRIIQKSGERKELRPLLRQCGEVIGDFVDAISEKVESVNVGAGAPAIKLRRKIEDTDWEPLAQKVMLSLEQSPQPLLFLFDELPEMLRKIASNEGEASTVRFLSWFRTVRLDDRDQMRRHRFAVAGSTGLNYFLDHKLGCPEALNDFERLPIEPLELADAAELCRQLADHSKLTISNDVIEQMLLMIGQPVPYFIQLFFSVVRQVLDIDATVLTAENVDVVYHTRLMGRFCKRYFDQYRRRLGYYPPNVECVLISLLVEVANGKQSVRTGRLYEVYRVKRGSEANEIEFCELMADLECDWYLQKEQDAYCFYMNVMKDWWTRWYGGVRAVEASHLSKH